MEVSLNVLKEIIVSASYTMNNFANIFSTSPLQTYPIKAVSLSGLNFDNLNCVGCYKQQYFNFLTYDFNFTDSNIKNVNKVYQGYYIEEYGQLLDFQGNTSFASITLFDEPAQSSLTSIYLASNLNVELVYGMNGAFLQMIQSPLSTQNYTMVIENSAFSNLTSASGSTVADIIDFSTSSLIILNSTFQFIAGYSGGQIINSYNSSKTKSIDQINVEFCSFIDIDPGYREAQYFAVSVQHDSNLSITVQNTQVVCNTNALGLENTDIYAMANSSSLALLEKSFSSGTNVGSFVFAQVGGNLTITSINNSFTKCPESFRGGIYHLSSDKQSVFSEQNSFYSNNYGGQGGVIYCRNCLEFILEKPIFLFNAAYQGGNLFLEYDESITDNITLYFTQLKLEESLSFTDAGFILFQCSNCNLNLTFSENSMDYLISSIFSTSVLTTLDSTPGGGLVKALARNLVVNILSNVITNVHSYTGNGGLLLLTSFNNIEVSIIGNKLVNVSDALKGTLLYANADGYSNIEYISNTFNCTDSITSEMFTQASYTLALENTTMGSVIYSRVNSPSQIISFNNSNGNCFVASQGDLGGAMFNIDPYTTLNDSFSNYTTFAAVQGGIYFCYFCTLYASFNIYTDVFCSQGCIVYSVFTSKIDISNSIIGGVECITEGAIAYLQNAQYYLITQAFYAKFSNIIVVDVLEYGKGSLVSSNQINQSISINNCSFSKFTLKKAATQGYQSSGININLAAELTLTNNYFEPSPNTDPTQVFQAILYAVGPNSNFTIENNIFTTGQPFNYTSVKEMLAFDIKTYQEASGSYEYYGWLQISDAYNVTLKNNKFINTSVNYQGPLTLIYCEFVFDYNSWFENNAAVTGGAMHFDNGQILVQNASFYNNYAQAGGVMNVLDTTILTIKDSNFISNQATSAGGVIYAFSSLSQSNLVPQINVINSKFENNWVFNQGGAIFIDNVILQMSITDCYFNNHSALGQGGAIYAKSGNTLTISSSEFYQNYASNGTIIYSVASFNNLTAKDSIFQCQDALYSLSYLTDALNTGYVLDSGITIKTANFVRFINNTVSQCQMSLKGGAIFLQETQFEDQGSTFISKAEFHNSYRQQRV